MVLAAAAAPGCQLAAASGNMQVQCGAPQVLLFFGGQDGSPGLQVAALGGVGQWDWWLAHVCGVAVYGWSVVAAALSGVGDRP